MWGCDSCRARVGGASLEGLLNTMWLDKHPHLPPLLCFHYLVGASLSHQPPLLPHAQPHPRNKTRHCRDVYMGANPGSRGGLQESTGVVQRRGALPRCRAQTLNIRFKRVRSRRAPAARGVGPGPPACSPAGCGGWRRRAAAPAARRRGSRPRPGRAGLWQCAAPAP